jgi:hypothetical protein
VKAFIKIDFEEVLSIGKEFTNGFKKNLDITLELEVYYCDFNKA